MINTIAKFFTVENSIGLAIAAVAVVLSALFSVFMRKRLGRALEARPLAHEFFNRTSYIIAPVLCSGLLIFADSFLKKSDLKVKTLAMAQPLAFAWLAIALIYTLTKSRMKTAVAALLVLPFALPVIGPYMAEAKNALDNLSFTFGVTSINAWQVLTLALSGLLLIWLAQAVIHAAEISLAHIPHMRSTTRQLLMNVSRTAIYALIGLFALSTLGIDLTAFAVLGGAVGVGIGFGLQKIASNFISGMILLLEKTVEVNDMVEFPSSNIFGLVRHTGARYTLIETVDNREIMVPNEDFISEKVVNWTHTDSRGLIQLVIGVSYDSDLDKVRTLLLEAASEHPRCLKDPAPACHLKDFAASAVEFYLFFWVADIREKRIGVKSDVMFSIWRKLKENGIGIPYPQMDLHVKELPRPIKEA